MVITADIETAAARIAPHVRRTPLTVSEPMSERFGATILIKEEHTQVSGSFKMRGALNKLLGLSEEERAAGVVTASSGNHGIATATAAGLAGTTCTVFLPSGASTAKVDAITRLGAEIVTVDSPDAYQAEVAARAAAESDGRTYVSPYNDPDIVAGQGTIGREILDQAASLDVPPIDAIVVAVGGGGLISGIASWVVDRAPSVQVIGASPANDHAMIASVEAGIIVDVPAEPTFSDGTAGGIEPDAVTFPICRSLVAGWLTITEVEIATAVAAMIDDHHQLVEGAAGVALAGAAEYATEHRGATIVAVTCGANVSSAALARMLHLG